MLIHKLAPTSFTYNNLRRTLLTLASGTLVKSETLGWTVVKYVLPIQTPYYWMFYLHGIQIARNKLSICILFCFLYNVLGWYRIMFFWYHTILNDLFTVRYLRITCDCLHQMTTAAMSSTSQSQIQVYVRDHWYCQRAGRRSNFPTHAWNPPALYEAQSLVLSSYLASFSPCMVQGNVWKCSLVGPLTSVYKSITVRQIVSTPLCFEWARNSILTVHLATWRLRGDEKAKPGVCCACSLAACMKLSLSCLISALWDWKHTQDLDSSNQMSLVFCERLARLFACLGCLVCLRVARLMSVALQHTLSTWTILGVNSFLPSCFSVPCCLLLGNRPSVATAPLQKPRSPHSRWKWFHLCFSLAGKVSGRLASGIVAKQLGNCNGTWTNPSLFLVLSSRRVGNLESWLGSIWQHEKSLPELVWQVLVERVSYFNNWLFTKFKGQRGEK